MTRSSPRPRRTSPSGPGRRPSGTGRRARPSRCPARRSPTSPATSRTTPRANGATPCRGRREDRLGGHHHRRPRQPQDLASRATTRRSRSRSTASSRTPTSRACRTQVKDGAAQGIVAGRHPRLGVPGPNKELGRLLQHPAGPARDRPGAGRLDDRAQRRQGARRRHHPLRVPDRLHQGARRPRSGSSECQGCEVLEFSNSPIAEVAQRQPALVTAWVQKYGTPLYITSVADYTADYQVPAAARRRRRPDRTSSSSRPTATARPMSASAPAASTRSSPRREPYRHAGLPGDRRAEPRLPRPAALGLRARQPYLVTPENVDAEGGDKNTFIPSNGYEERYSRAVGRRELRVRVCAPRRTPSGACEVER